ncbi:MAG: hypothetical protein FVQ79_03885 [Planctomycetes bacterium]|nr:hypothetical protein [Planctomycetota bacterium]
MAHLKITTSVEGEAVSLKLRPLLEAVYDEIKRRPANLHRLKASLERLLIFLGTPEGRTNANCCATDCFFLLREGWETGWDYLPDSFSDILDDMAGALHDSVKAPEVASNFESTPEQLFERLQSIIVK